MREPILYNAEGEDAHILDEPLGNIHECALALAFIGMKDWALKIAKAHEKIEAYLIAEKSAQESVIESLKADNLHLAERADDASAYWRAAREAMEVVESIRGATCDGSYAGRKLRKHFGLEGRQNG